MRKINLCFYQNKKTRQSLPGFKILSSLRLQLLIIFKQHPFFLNAWHETQWPPSYAYTQCILH